MKKICLAILTLGVIASSAMADVADKTAAGTSTASFYDWSGIYIGLNAGAASSGECWTNIPTGGYEGCHTGNGFIGGGQVGINFQNGPWVFGLEAMGDFASLKGNNITRFFAQPHANETTVNGIGTFVGRFGYAINNVLIFVNGGGAWNEAKRTETVRGIMIASQDTWRWGWTAGAGFEYGLTPNWSVGLDYQYMRFTGTVYITCPTCIPRQSPLPESISQNIHALMARVNYHFKMP